jgi:hypothetical protein
MHHLHVVNDIVAGLLVAPGLSLRRPQAAGAPP